MPLLGYTVYSGGLIIPVLLGFYREKLKLNTFGAMLAIAGGGGLTLFLKLSGHGNLLLLTIPISALLLFAGSYAGRVVQDARKQTESHCQEPT